MQGYLRDRMQAGYDAEYLRQIFDFIVYTISCMEAPARRESTQKVRPSYPFSHPPCYRDISSCGSDCNIFRRPLETINLALHAYEQAGLSGAAADLACRAAKKL